MSSGTREVGEDSLGKWTEFKPGVGGLSRVYWYVPKRFRKPWETHFKAVLTSEPGQGDLSDPAEVLRIRSEADRLNLAREAQIIEKEKSSERTPAATPKVVTFKILADLWQNGMTYQSRVGKERHKHYETALRHISRHAWRLPDHVNDLVQSDIEAFLKTLKPYMKVECKSTLSQMYKRGIAEELCTKDPTRGIRFEEKVGRVDLWSDDDLSRMRQAAEREGRPSLSAAMYFAWLIGQRIKDVLKLRHGVEYGNGRFEFDQNKTGEPIKLPITVDDARLLRSLRSDEHDFLFKDDTTGRRLTYENLNRNFARLRQTVQTSPQTHRKKKLLIKNLRHTCIVRLLEQGSHPVEIAAVSGHVPASIYKIMRAYGIGTEKLATMVVIRDHLARGGKIEDFDHDPALNEVMKPREPLIADSGATPDQLAALVISVSELDDSPTEKSASSSKAKDTKELAAQRSRTRTAKPAKKVEKAEARRSDAVMDVLPASDDDPTSQGESSEDDVIIPPWWLQQVTAPRAGQRPRRRRTRQAMT